MGACRATRYVPARMMAELPCLIPVETTQRVGAMAMESRRLIARVMTRKTGLQAVVLCPTYISLRPSVGLQNLPTQHSVRCPLRMVAGGYSCPPHRETVGRSPQWGTPPPDTATIRPVSAPPGAGPPGFPAPRGP